MPVIPISFALGVGVGGALIDVTSYVEGGDGITRSYGKQDQFRDTSPGTFTVTLSNRDGRFTPNNVPTVVTATTLTASTLLAAVSFTTASTIPAGSFVVIDTGVNAEMVVTGTPSGSGPYTIPVVAAPGIATVGLRFAHATGVAVGPATTVTEGMAANLSIGGRYTAGTIQAIMLPSDDLTWGQITFTCDDMLGNASRRNLGVLVDSINQGATRFLMYPLDDAAGTVIPREVTGAGVGLLTLVGTAGSTFATAAVTGLTTTQLTLKDSLTTVAGTVWPVFPFVYPTTSLGFYSFWITPTILAKIVGAVSISGLIRTLQFGYVTGNYFVRDGDSGTSATFASTDTGPHFVSMGLGTSFAAGVWTITATLYVDGVSRGSIVCATTPTALAYRAPVAVTLIATV